MPIYEYRCSSCGHELEALQKISEPALRTCPACQKDDLAKLVSAAGFQLKGSGWYATDFRNNGTKPAAKPAATQDSAASGDGAKTEGKSESKPDSTSGTAAAPAAGCGGGCSCH